MATTKITNPELFDLGSLNTALKLPSGTTAERPTSPSTGEWRYNTDNNLIEYYDGGSWRELQDEEIPPVPSENFNVVLYTGNGTSQSITGVGFEPDFVWVKARDRAGEWHMLSDSTRGTNSQIFSNATNAQDTKSTVITSFDSDGFSIGSDALVNFSGATYVAWCWKANGGTTSSNTDGSITSTVQANTKTGFSIISYNGNGTSGATIGHGLSVAPELLIFKRLNATESWNVWSSSLSSQVGFLNLNNAFISYSVLGASASTITLNNGTGHNASGSPYICYAFAPSTGYSKFGSYTGNGTTQAIDTGFEPAFLMLKSTSQTGDWFIFDNKRSPSNPRNNRIKANLADAESTSSNQVNFLTNGFYFGSTAFNDSGRTFFYIAFASDPSAAPVLADSFNNSLWTGNGTSQSITGVGFQPSFTWIKSRNITYDHALTDVVRGTSNPVYLTTGAQFSNSTFITSFDADGFSIGNNAVVNNNTNTYVGWSWKSNSIPTINTDGTIQTIVSANPASGFSIVQLGTAGPNTYGHGLTAAPEIIFFKMLNVTAPWYTYNKDLNGGSNPAAWFLKLDSSAVETNNPSGSLFNTTEPTSTVFSTGTSIGNAIAYCFHSVDGFSKIGSYTGNGSAGHAITGLGFQPNFILIKGITSADNWFIFDSARGDSVTLNANLNAAEYADTGVTSFDSDGFTLGSGAGENRNGDTYIYMAFKNNPAALPIASGEMAFLVVAGGGGGGYLGGGAGAGGLRTSYGPTSGGGASAESNITLASGTYTVTVGAGGSGSTGAGINFDGTSGSDSSIAATGLTTITSIGGGYGGNHDTTPPASGGSGGGADSSGVSRSGASGTAGQGYAGGANYASGGVFGSGGGGGASAVGTDGTSTDSGNGGNGLTVSITSSSVTYAGGGGGGRRSTAGGGVAGTGGGGAGGQGAPGGDGTPNTGGGGGGTGGTGDPAGDGGSGVAILRMNTTDYSGVTTGSPTVTTDGDYTVLTYTGSGTYVHS